MTTMESPGVLTDKPINLSQLQLEMETAGVTIQSGLGMTEGWVYTYDAEGQPADFATADQPIVDQAIADHVAMRDKTDAELATEFQAEATTAARKQEIRDQQAGLIPRETVEM